MSILRYQLRLGAEAPFKIIHASDTHLTLADDRDDERKNTLAGKRARVFPDAMQMLHGAEELAQTEHAAFIAHTGDLIDFVSSANLDEARRFTHANCVFTAAGNHEFSLYVGEALEDEAYRNQSLARVQAVFTNDIRQSSTVYNGIKFIALDNGYYLFERKQLEFLKRECACGLPVVLLMHTPLFTPELHEYMLNMRGNPCGYLCGTPEALTRLYPENRRIQQTPDEPTLETVKFIKSCPAIKCILTGHIHADVRSILTPALTQYAVGLDSLAVFEIS
ncbi:MAG: metallophosphoesterase [Clostridia bacterium]|nr:metallophosphoesterase [Clostridia bacterium]